LDHHVLRCAWNPRVVGRPYDRFGHHLRRPPSGFVTAAEGRAQRRQTKAQEKEDDGEKKLHQN
jgi:hypothetical protein